MSYQEGDKTRIKRQLSKQAVTLAMEGKWKEAISANESILENFPNDADTYNRIGRAHMELGEYSRARQAYERAIEFDPYNTIAKRNLQRLSLLNDTVAGVGIATERVDPQSFIEEVGKAGVITLHKLGELPVLAKTVAGSRVGLKVSGTSLIAENNFGEYLGLVEQKQALRLIRLMNGGNKYTAAVISSSEEGVSIIIKESYQDPSQVGIMSFPPRSLDSIRADVSDRIDDRLIRRQLEEENVSSRESGYEIMGEGIEVLTDDDSDDEDEDSE
jgi:tetratricopeptide (TPR) repeat protein